MTRSAPCPASATILPERICSICFGLPTPAVDGNVLRVVSRLTADERPVTQPAVKKDYTAALAEIYPTGQCAEATQALMELGATICAPNGAPHCDLCPVAAFCQSREGERWRTIPVKEAKKAPPRGAENGLSPDLRRPYCRPQTSRDGPARGPLGAAERRRLSGAAARAGAARNLGPPAHRAEKAARKAAHLHAHHMAAAVLLR